MISREQQRELDEKFADMCSKYPNRGCTFINARGESTDCPYNKTSKCENAFMYQQGIAAERDRICDIIKDELESGYLMEKLLREIHSND